MYRRSDPTDWMWAQACDLIEEAERMHRRFFRLAPAQRDGALWEPPADVFEDEREVVIVVAMPGVAAEGIEVTSEPGAIVVRAQRRPPLASANRVVRQLEIPYGSFERRIALPRARFAALSHELSHGCLVLRLAKEE